MKIYKTIFICSALALFTISCEQELDPITPVKPGADMEAPTVVIDFPATGKVVRVLPDQTKVTLTATASDDIELKSVTFVLDDQEVGKATSFKDYRRAVVNQEVENIADGDHVLKVTVEDMTGKSESKTRNFRKVTATPYTPLVDEVIYFPFEGDLTEAITGNSAVKQGSPSFVTGKIGDAYAGATDAYFTYPATDLTGSSEFSVAFWYKLNPVPPRGGLISMSRPEVVAQDNRNSGFRMGHEPSGDNQNIFVNLGNNPTLATGEVSMNPFYVVTPGTDWIHIAVSVATDSARIYVNSENVMTTELLTPIDWTGVTSISVASGQPNWIYWDHLSDLSLFDEMHFFKRAITREEVNTLFTATK